MSKIRAMFQVLLAALLLAVATADKDMEMPGLSKVKILATSGEMQFQRMLNETLTGSVKIVMEKVVQITTAGQEVAGTVCIATTLTDLPLKPIEMFKDFAKQAFTIADKKVGQPIPNANSTKGMKTNFFADLGSKVGTLSINAVLAEEDGEVSIDGEKQPLKKGDMKFNMQLSKWKWCGTNGTAGAAAFLDLYMKVTGKVAAALKNSGSDSAPAAFDLGDNITMSFSKKLKKDDGAWEDMASGYPKMNGNLFILRFPRFTNTIEYDPTVYEGGASDDDDSGDSDSGDASGIKMSAVLTAMAAVMAYVAL